MAGSYLTTFTFGFEGTATLCSPLDSVEIAPAIMAAHRIQGPAQHADPQPVSVRDHGDNCDNDAVL